MTDKKRSSRQVVVDFLDTLQVGATFTMLDVRDYCPGVNAIDRRLRELREREYSILSRKDDPTLKMGEYRFERRGDPTLPGRVMSNRVRRVVFDRDSNMCVPCGVGAGEPYPDEPLRKAKLQVGHVVPKSKGGSDDVPNLRAECDRCNESIQDTQGGALPLQEVQAEFESLSDEDKTTLQAWVSLQRRLPSKVDLVWARLRQLPATDRDALEALVDASVTRPDLAG